MGVRDLKLTLWRSDEAGRSQEGTTAIRQRQLADPLIGDPGEVVVAEERRLAHVPQGELLELARVDAGLRQHVQDGLPHVGPFAEDGLGEVETDPLLAGRIDASDRVVAHVGVEVRPSRHSERVTARPAAEPRRVVARAEIAEPALLVALLPVNR